MSNAKVRNVHVGKQQGENIELSFDIEKRGISETVIARTKMQDLYDTAENRNWLVEEQQTGNVAQERKTGT